MSLSPTAIALLGLVAWALLLLLLILNQRGMLVLSGRVAVNAFAPDGSNAGGFGQRLARAHANCLENLPLQVAVLLYALQAGQTAITDPWNGNMFQVQIVNTSAGLKPVVTCQGPNGTIQWPKQAALQ